MMLFSDLPNVQMCLRSIQSRPMEAKKLTEQLYTFEEYMAIEQAEDIRHEFISGKIFPMPGGSMAHNLISNNLRDTMSRNASDQCLTFSSDVRLEHTARDRYYYPDVMLTCAPEDTQFIEKTYVKQPVLVAEVLSPSTEDHDRNGKFKAYMELPSLLYYLLLSQEEYSVEVYERQDLNNWNYRRHHRLDALIALPLLKMKLLIEDLYRRVVLEEKDAGE